MSDGLPVVVIDPGHGGSTKVGGSSPNNATGPNGLLEKELTLDLAQRVATFITSMGNAQVILTRTTDTNLALVDRAKVAKDNNAAVFLSIHLNGWTNPDVDGTEVWIAPNANSQSKAFATTLLNYLVAVTGVRNRGIQVKDFGVLQRDRHAPDTAACLAEIAFLTNPAQALRLEDNGYRQVLAQAMAEAVLQQLPAPVAVTHSLAMVGSGYSTPSPVPTSSYYTGGSLPASGIRSSALDAITLGYGVPGGKITDPFYRDATEKQKLLGKQHGRTKHLGIDVSLSNEHGDGADDPRRGLPVYATVKPSIEINELNGVRAVDSHGNSQNGLGISGKGTATLQNALVLGQPWNDRADHSYGGVLGIACRYAYTKFDGSPGLFTLYIEYLHLITPEFLPKDGNGNIISADAWKATGKGIGFGPQMQNRSQLSAAQLTGGSPILVGYLGATQFPHVHIQAAYGDGQREYLKAIRFDPTVALANSLSMTRTQALASFGLSSADGNGNHARGHTLADLSFDYSVPGTVPLIPQPYSMACWATVATMMRSWHDNTRYSIEQVLDLAGPTYRPKFIANGGLGSSEKGPFLDALQLHGEPPMDYTVDGLLSLLRAYGPLWATTYENIRGLFAIHARVITRIYGDGSLDGTFVQGNDPLPENKGHQYTESFRDFMQKFDDIARKDLGAGGDLRIQIVHF
jgi:N-acetylmuramoyl-L-alanine amidase